MSGPEPRQCTVAMDINVGAVLLPVQQLLASIGAHWGAFALVGCADSPYRAGDGRTSEPSVGGSNPSGRASISA